MTAERGSGRTTAQLMSLQAGDGFIVHSGKMWAYTKPLLEHLKQQSLKDTGIALLLVRDFGDENRLLGFRGRLIVDHETDDYWLYGTDRQIALRRRVMDLIDHLDRRRGAA